MSGSAPSAFRPRQGTLRAVSACAAAAVAVSAWAGPARSNPGNEGDSPATDLPREEATLDTDSYFVAVQAPSGAESQAAPEPPPPVLEPPPGVEWLKSRGSQCFRKWPDHQFCQGPRRVPRPRGPEAALAAKLGLGKKETMWMLLLEAPDPRWVAAAGPAGEPRPLLWPLPGGKLWRGVGRVSRAKRAKIHKGVDIGPSDGNLLFRSASDGIVVYSNNEIRGYGNLMAVVHPDGSVAFYAHAKELYLFPGQRVRRGQVLGKIGNTGFAWGPHLHFEYRVNGRAVNPLKKFARQ